MTYEVPRFLDSSVSPTEQAQSPRSGQWTFVTDGLPTKAGRYWVCATHRPEALVATWKGEGWSYRNELVVAWMPLPELPPQPWPKDEARRALYKSMY